MARRSARTNLRRIKSTRKPNSRTARAKSGAGARSRPGARAARGGVRVVRSRSTGARKHARPLPAPEPLSERPFLSSLERSLREYRPLWEALAKR